MKRLIAMHGLPRSGKSTVARELRIRLGAPVVSGDAIRLALHGQRYAADAEPMVRALKLIMIKALFGAGHEIVISDDTHFSYAAREFVRSDDWETEFFEVNTDVETCIERAIQTGQPDLIPVIRMMAVRWEPLGDEEKRYAVVPVSM